MTSSNVDQCTAEHVELEIYRGVRKRFYRVADAIFGPGFLSMAEYYFIKTTGHSPITMLFSGPRLVYDEWAKIFKGEENIRYLIEQVEGAGDHDLLGSIQNNDGIKVWDFFQKVSNDIPLTA